MRTFKRICRMNKDTLKSWLEKQLRNKYKDVINGDGFLYAPGKDVLLTAHMDTVHKVTCRDIQVTRKDNKTILTSPQGIGGDDRCGIWIILQILQHTKYRPSILFCEDEEIGGVGSSKFVETDYIDDFENLHYLIELDRANSKDAVFYDCGNRDFKKYVETFGLKEDYGSFSDIGHLSPACDRASVNISCGYYKQHTLEEYVVFEEMKDAYKTVCAMLADAPKSETYDYQEYSPFDYYSRHRIYSNWWDRYSVSKHRDYEFLYKNDAGLDEYDYSKADSFEAAVGEFLMAHPNLRWNDVLDYYTY